MNVLSSFLGLLICPFLVEWSIVPYVLVYFYLSIIFPSCFQSIWLVSIKIKCEYIFGNQLFCVIHTFCSISTGFINNLAGGMKKMASKWLIGFMLMVAHRVIAKCWKTAELLTLISSYSKLCQISRIGKTIASIWSI